MLDNGYQNKESLLAFDVKEDLPLLPVLNMAQKSLLRKVLIQLHDNQDFESKINEIKGCDEEDIGFNTTACAIDEQQKKRKRESTLSPLTKRSKTDDLRTDSRRETDFGPKMREFISKRKSIRSETEFDLDFETEVNEDLFAFSRRSGRKFNESIIDTNEESGGEEEVEDRQRRQRLSGVGYRYTKRVDNEKNVREETPSKVFNGLRNRLRGRPSMATNSSIDRTPEANRRTTRLSTPNPRLSTTLSIGIKSETNNRPSIDKTYIPTAAQLEVMQRVEQKKVLGNKKTQKRRI